jgi:2-dehydropantoate 2-reductase
VRFVVYGAGAIGGAVGARLHQAGHEVTLIARGAHYEAIRAGGLTISDPEDSATLEIDVAQAPSATRWDGEEIVLLAMKGQDSLQAVTALRDCAPAHTPIVCLQNGIENERVALRLFANVYAAAVMVPAAHLEPGVVLAYGAALTGMIDVGRYPRGVDPRSRSIVEALGSSRFESIEREDVLRFKYAKLLINLGNAVEAACPPGDAAERLTELAREEGRDVLRAARIAFDAPEVDDVLGRWERMGVREIRGRPRAGSSTRQSLLRGGPVESDFLNGEIVLLGRLHGVATPVNELLQREAARVARERGGPGSVAAEELLEKVGVRPAWTS